MYDITADSVLFPEYTREIRIKLGKYGVKKIGYKLLLLLRLC